VDTDAASGHAGHDAWTRDAHEAGGDARGHVDAGRAADARAADVAVDATTVDASVREASAPVDAGPHDATQHVEAVADAGLVDAGHDASAADATRDAAPVCTYPDAATGTMGVLAEVPGVVIQDFDIDSENVFFTTSTGGVLSCPASGCSGAPTTVWPADPDGGVPQLPSFLVRIGLGGLVFAENLPCGPGECANMSLVLMGRDGSNVRMLPQPSPFGELTVPQSLAVSDSAIFCQAASWIGDSSITTWLDAVSPYADGGPPQTESPSSGGGRGAGVGTPRWLLTVRCSTASCTIPSVIRSPRGVSSR